MTSHLEILFSSPDHKIDGENKSKLLSETCDLYQFIIQVRNILSNLGISFHCRSPHIELWQQTPQENDIEEYKNRVYQIHSTRVDKNVFMLTDKALVIYTGIINIYGPTHSTIAYFKDGLSYRQFEILKKIISNVSSLEEVQKNINEFKTIQAEKVKSQTKDINTKTNEKNNKKIYPDWWCETCLFKIFGSKSECFKCKTKRPNLFIK